MHQHSSTDTSTTWLVPPSLAASKSKKNSRRKGIWIGIRGSGHYQSALSKALGSESAKLVPQRNNTHDIFAIAISANQRIIGYVPTNLARVLYSQIGFLKLGGHECMVPLETEKLEYNDTISAWACVPSIQGLNTIAPLKEVFNSLDPLWNSVPIHIQHDIEKNGYHLNEEHASTLWSLKDNAPDFWFSRGLSEDVTDIGITLYLKNLRANAAKKAKRERAARDRSILRCNDRGMTNGEIASKHGVSSSTVGKILKSAGRNSNRAIPDPNRISSANHVDLSRLEHPYYGFTRYNAEAILNRAEKCVRAANLQRTGISRAKIAEIMDISLKSVEKYLPDGKFYIDPRINEHRMELASNLMRTQKSSEESASELRQARVDAVVISTFHLKEPSND